MIESRKSRAFTRWFAGRARARLAATFDSVRVAGHEDLRARLERGPALLVANHTAWWDALVALVLSEHVLRCDAHAITWADNLRRLPFFSAIGAFGVERDDPADGAAAVRHAARLLDRPGRALWIHPQGSERPVTERPPRFRPGVALIARRAPGAAIVPVALRYDFGVRERPVCRVAFGEALALPPGRAAARRALEHAVDARLESLERAARGADDGFETVVEGRAAPLERLATAVLAALTRGFVVDPRRDGPRGRS